MRYAAPRAIVQLTGTKSVLVKGRIDTKFNLQHHQLGVV